jgi:hypothetical protein
MKETKSLKNKKTIVLFFCSVLMIGFMYNAGEAMGEYFYVLGISI